MKRLIWLPIAIVLIALGTVGFCLATILVVVGLVMHYTAEALGQVFDWYQIQFLRMITYLTKRVG